MVSKKLESLKTYKELYEFVAQQPRTREEVYDFAANVLELKSRTSLNAYVNNVFKGVFPFFAICQDKATIDEGSYREFIEDICEIVGLDPYKLFENPVEYSQRVIELKFEIQELNEKLTDGKKALAKKLSQYEAERTEELENLQKQLNRLKNNRRKKTCAQVLEEMDKKVIVTPSIKSVPRGVLGEDFFLDESHPVLDIPYLVSQYGGEKDSVYKVITGEETNLEVKPYVSRVFQKLMAIPIFKKRFEDESKLEVEDYGTISEKLEKYYERRKITGAEMYENRMRAINQMLENESMTNQMKLAYYAAMRDRADRDMRDLLEYAGDNCVDAADVIRLLENPIEFNNYHNIRGFMRQAMKPAEARIKRETVRELICGEWYVEAEYNGQKCKFQMLPVTELEAFKDALESRAYESAIAHLDKLIAIEREARFENDELKNELIVMDKADEKVTSGPGDQK